MVQHDSLNYLTNNRKFQALLVDNILGPRVVNLMNPGFIFVSEFLCVFTKKLSDHVHTKTHTTSIKTIIIKKTLTKEKLKHDK